MESRFEEVIATRDRLRELNKLPSHRVSNKSIDHVDDICRRFVEGRSARVRESAG